MSETPLEYACRSWAAAYADSEYAVLLTWIVGVVATVRMLWPWTVSGVKATGAGAVAGYRFVFPAPPPPPAPEPLSDVCLTVLELLDDPGAVFDHKSRDLMVEGLTIALSTTGSIVSIRAGGNNDGWDVLPDLTPAEVKAVTEKFTDTCERIRVRDRAARQQESLSRLSRQGHGNGRMARTVLR